MRIATQRHIQIIEIDEDVLKAASVGDILGAFQEESLPRFPLDAWQEMHDDDEEFVVVVLEQREEEARPSCSSQHKTRSSLTIPRIPQSAPILTNEHID